MSVIERFDFDGFDNSYVELHPKHGLVVQSHRFITWLGWAKSSDVRRDHLQPGDEVELEPRGDISPRSDQAKRRGAVTDSPKYLTKRGVRRLLFRSNHPRAVAYTDEILDLLDLVDEAQKVGIDVVEELRQRVAEQQQIIDMQGQQLIEESMDYEDYIEELLLDLNGFVRVRRPGTRIMVVKSREELAAHRRKVAAKTTTR